MKTTDMHGAVVTVGCKVRVLSIKPSVLRRVNEADAKAILSMVDQTLEVYEVDEYGCAWVSKKWEVDNGRSVSHSLSLNPSEMELQSDPHQ